MYRDGSKQTQPLSTGLDKKTAEPNPALLSAAAQLRRRKLEEERLKQLEAERERVKQEEAQKQREAFEAQQQADQERAFRAGRQATLREQYVATIAVVVTDNWLRPPTAKAGLRCTVRVVQIPGGEVISSSLVGRCNGDEATRRSILAAVDRTGRSRWSLPAEASAITSTSPPTIRRNSTGSADSLMHSSRATSSRMYNE